MVKKLFALASVSALTGLVMAAGVAGCTTETVETTPTEDAGTTDAKKDSKPTIDAGDEEEEDDIPTCAGSWPGLPKQYAYQPAGEAQVGACSEDQIYAAVEAAESVIKSEKQLNFDKDIAPKLGDGSETCAACLKGSATEWRVFNEGSLFYFNLFGCLESKKVIPNACADALYGINICFSLVCGSCQTQAEQNECIAWAVENDCSEFDTSSCEDAFNSGGGLSQLLEDNGCSENVNVADSFCGTGKGELDGGT